MTVPTTLLKMSRLMFLGPLVAPSRKGGIGVTSMVPRICPELQPLRQYAILLAFTENLISIVLRKLSPATSAPKLVVKALQLQFNEGRSDVLNFW